MIAQNMLKTYETRKVEKYLLISYIGSLHVLLMVYGKTAPIQQ